MRGTKEPDMDVDHEGDDQEMRDDDNNSENNDDEV